MANNSYSQLHNISVPNSTAYNHTDHILTAPAPPGQRYSVQLQIVSFFSVLILTASIIINGLCLLAFYKERALRTVFNYYLINLTVADLAYTLTVPLQIVDNFYKPTPISGTACFFKLIVSWTTSSVAVHTVALIGFDRLWAVCWPHHYRQNKSKKLSGGIIAVTWAWVLASMLPGVIANRILDPNTRRCGVNFNFPFTQLWGQIVNFTSFLVPILMVIATYVLILFRLNRMAKARVHVQTTNSKEASQPKTGTTDVQTLAMTQRNQDNDRSTDVQTVAPARNKKEKDRRVLRMFGYLTLSITICWLPGDIYYPILSFLPDVFYEPLNVTMQMLLYASCFVNPLVYQLSGTNELRDVIANMFGLKKTARVGPGRK